MRAAQTLPSISPENLTFSRRALIAIVTFRELPGQLHGIPDPPFSMLTELVRSCPIWALIWLI
jgi:hypothetical protein